MNGIEKLTERIAAESEEKCRSILDQGKAQAAEILAGYTSLADAQYAEAVENGAAAAEDRVERLGSVAQLDARKLRLQAKQEMLTRAFDLALEKLLNLPEQEYVALLSKLAAEGSVTGKEALVLSVQDRPRYGKKVVVTANEYLEKAGKNAQLTLSEESRDFQGGLYIQDGSIENNCTFPTIIRMLREQMAGEVAEILFES